MRRAAVACAGAWGCERGTCAARRRRLVMTMASQGQQGEQRDRGVDEQDDEADCRPPTRRCRAEPLATRPAASGHCWWSRRRPPPTTATGSAAGCGNVPAVAATGAVSPLRQDRRAPDRRRRRRRRSRETAPRPDAGRRLRAGGSVATGLGRRGSGAVRVVTCRGAAATGRERSAADEPTRAVGWPGRLRVSRPARQALSGAMPLDAQPASPPRANDPTWPDRPDVPDAEPSYGVTSTATASPVSPDAPATRRRPAVTRCGRVGPGCRPRGCRPLVRRPRRRCCRRSVRWSRSRRRCRRR